MCCSIAVDNVTLCEATASKELGEGRVKTEVVMLDFTNKVLG